MFSGVTKRLVFHPKTNVLRISLFLGGGAGTALPDAACLFSMFCFLETNVLNFGFQTFAHLLTPLVVSLPVWGCDPCVFFNSTRGCAEGRKCTFCWELKFYFEKCHSYVIWMWFWCIKNQGWKEKLLKFFKRIIKWRVCRSCWVSMFTPVARNETKTQNLRRWWFMPRPTVSHWCSIIMGENHLCKMESVANWNSIDVASNCNLWLLFYYKFVLQYGHFCIILDHFIESILGPLWPPEAPSLS